MPAARRSPREAPRLTTPFDHEQTIPEGEHPLLSGRYRVEGHSGRSLFVVGGIADYLERRSSLVSLTSGVHHSVIRRSDRAMPGSCGGAGTSVMRVIAGGSAGRPAATSLIEVKLPGIGK